MSAGHEVRGSRGRQGTYTGLLGLCVCVCVCVCECVCVCRVCMCIHVIEWCKIFSVCVCVTCMFVTSVKCFHLQQLSIPKSAMATTPANLVEFEVSPSGLSMVDPQRRLFSRKNFSVKHITYVVRIR